MKLVGATDRAPKSGLAEDINLSQYGSEKKYVLASEGAGVMLSEGLSEAMVRFAARHEYARTVEDVLARRTRQLFLDAKQARNVAPRVAELLQEETGVDPQLAAFLTLSDKYLWLPEQNA